MKTSLVKIKVGDRVQYLRYKNGMLENPIVTIIDFYLAPNGINNSELLTIITAEYINGDRIQATSDKFQALESENYESCYPSEVLCK